MPRYEQARTDPDLLSLRDDIALLDTRITDVMGGLETGEHDDLWIVLKGMHGDILSAIAGDDLGAAKKALDNMGHVLEQGASQRGIWNDIFGLLEQRRKLVEGERRRLVDLQQMITAERAFALGMALVDAVIKRTSDQVIINGVANDFREIFGADDDLAIEAGSTIAGSTR